MTKELTSAQGYDVGRRDADQHVLVIRRTTEKNTFIDSDERRTTTRRKTERRRHIDPTTCERDYSGEEIEFMTAMDEYKRRSGRQFPTWSEVLEVVRSLGYRKTAEPMEIKL